MQANQIVNLEITKTAKIKRLLALGLTRKEVATLMNVGYGFVQNVYAKEYGTSRTNNRFGNRYFGVEIEAFNIPRADLTRALKRAGIKVKTDNRSSDAYEQNYWKVTTDSSIAGNQTFELVSPKLKGTAGIKELEKVCEVLKQKNAKINKSCGLHIHLDATDFSLDDWKALIKNHINYEKLITSFMPKSRRKNTYCKSMMKSYGSKKSIYQAIDRCNSIEDIRDFYNSKYYRLNVQSYFRHKSVEFRQHSGTIEFEKIKNWILLLNTLVKKAKKHEVARQGGITSFKKNVPSKTLKFYQERQAKFA
ncbi:MAG: amidoligase family protein [Chitinophagales bacterium]